MTIDFKGGQHPKNVILYSVFFYVRYAVSYRDLEEIMAERGVDVDQVVSQSLGFPLRLVSALCSAATTEVADSEAVGQKRNRCVSITRPRTGRRLAH